MPQIPMTEAHAPIYQTISVKPEGLRLMDSLEISHINDDPEDCCLRVPASEDFHFFGLYGHIPDKGTIHLADFLTMEEAEAKARSLLAKYPNMQRFGLTIF